MKALAPRRDHRPQLHLLPLALAFTALIACGGTVVETREGAIERRAGIVEAYTTAQLARHLGDLESAELWAARGVLLAPGDGELVRTYGELLRLNGHYEAAVQALTEGIERVADPIPLYLERATAQELLGDLMGADASYQGALTRRPDDLDAVIQYAGFAQRVRSGERATEILEAFLARQPESARGWRTLGRIRAEIAQNEDALDAYRRAADLEPRTEIDYVPMLRLARGTGEHALADSIAEECFHTFRQNVACRVEYIRDLDARTLAEDSRRARTFAVLQSLGRTIGANLGLLRHVERRLVNELDAERALMFLEAVAADRPRNGQIQARTAWAAYRVGQEDSACEYMGRVLEVNPRSPDALNFIAYSYAERGIRLEEAEALVRRALEVRPDDGNIQDSLGWVYYRAGRFEEAVEWLEVAVDNIPDSAVLRDHLADAYRGRGDFANALKQYVFARALADDELRQSIQAKIEEIEAALNT